MADARWRWLPGLWQTHFEELAWLAGQRRGMLRSDRAGLREFSDLNERMEAHLQGLAVPPPAERDARLRPWLRDGERDEAFAAAHALLRAGDADGQAAVLAALGDAGPPARAGLRDALGMGDAARLRDGLTQVLGSARPEVAVAAAVALANLAALSPAHPRLAALLQDEDPTTVAWAWRAVAVSDAGAPGAGRPYMAGVTHTDAAVRTAAWGAAAWTGQAPALPLLRERAQAADPVALDWLAVLGGAEEVATLRAAAGRLSPVERAALWARHGHADWLEDLLSLMAGEDMAAAVAAREAFTRITGEDVRGRRERLRVADDADEFTREMAPPVWLPDLDRARRIVGSATAPWSRGGRWRRGLPLEAVPSPAVLAQLDFEARWDGAARAAWRGQRISRPAPVL